MFSSPFRRHSSEHTSKKKVSSYTFGPHTSRVGSYVHYISDARVVTQDPKKIIMKAEPTPAWVVAEYILAKRRGEPLSDYEELLIAQPFQSEGLKWLRQAGM